MKWGNSDEGARDVVYERLGPEGPQTRHLELEYAPMYADDKVERIMVVAKDVTELKSARARA